MLHGWRWILRSIALVLVLGLLGPAVAQAIQIDRDVRDRVVPAAVEIAAITRWSENDFSLVLPLGIGSGTIISADGLILTNHHVIEPTQFDDVLKDLNESMDAELPGVTVELQSSDFFILVSDGVSPPIERYTARVVASDELLDLAVLRITGDAAGSAEAVQGEAFPFVPIGDSDTMGLGDRVHVFSYPAIGGDVLTYTDGAVSGFQFEEGIVGAAWITTDAVLSGGSSGGTAINDAGELIGVPTQGSELDCRPGDTNRDGVIDLQDIGCIPTGGSLGQLRPINQARDLLEQAASQDVSEASTPVPATATTVATAIPTGSEKPTPRPRRLRGAETPTPEAPTPKTPTLETPGPETPSRPDLPSLALTPADLETVGLTGFVVDWGQLTDLGGLSTMLGIDAIWNDAIAESGVDRAYYLRNVEFVSEGETPRSISTTILSYPDRDSATRGFNLLESEVEATLVTTAEPTGFVGGDASELTSWTFTDTTTNEEMVSFELTIQSGALVGAVRLVAPNAMRELAMADTEALAASLLNRLVQASDASIGNDMPLSGQVVRIEDNGLTSGGDYYLLRDEVVLPLYWYSPPDVADQWDDYWQLIGVATAYETDIYLPTDYAITGPRARVNVRLYDFVNAESADAYVSAFEDDIVASGVTDLSAVTTAPAFGENSRTYEFQTDWWSDIEPEYRIATAMQQGKTVAIVELAAAAPVPTDVLIEVATAQEACLVIGCTSLTIPAPVWMQETHGALMDGAAPSTPMPSSVSTLVPVPQTEPPGTIVPVPTAPAPIPEATEEFITWGFDDTFDETELPFSGTDVSEFSLANGQLTLSILASGGLDGFTYDVIPTEGRDFAYAVELVSTSGWGEITLSLGSEDGATAWLFAIDPVTTQWSLYRSSDATSEMFYWVEPRTYASLAPGALQSVAVEVRGGAPVLLINGVDVVSPLGLAMPEMPGSLIVGFGAGINPFSLSGSGESFTVVIDRISLFELAN